MGAVSLACLEDIHSYLHPLVIFLIERVVDIIKQLYVPPQYKSATIALLKYLAGLAIVTYRPYSWGGLLIALALC